MFSSPPFVGFFVCGTIVRFEDDAYFFLKNSFFLLNFLSEIFTFNIIHMYKPNIGTRFRLDGGWRWRELWCMV